MNFQSPFSGDFLCFFSSFQSSRSVQTTFNLHFQEIFFVSRQDDEVLFDLIPLTFNLHFQEIFFVSQLPKSFYNFGAINYFQSPFSGDFLCFGSGRAGQKEVSKNLSISIFRRFSLFLEQYDTYRRTIKKILSISIFRRFSLFQILIRSV